MCKRNRLSLWLLGLIHVCFSALGQAQDPYVLCDQGVCGVVSPDGQALSQQVYSHIGPYLDGLALFSASEQVGLLDVHGQVVLPARYARIEWQAGGSVVLAYSKNTAGVEQLAVLDRQSLQPVRQGPAEALKSQYNLEFSSYEFRYDPQQHTWFFGNQRSPSTDADCRLTPGSSQRQFLTDSMGTRLFDMVAHQPLSDVVLATNLNLCKGYFSEGTESIEAKVLVPTGGPLRGQLFLQDGRFVAPPAQDGDLQEFHWGYAIWGRQQGADYRYGLVDTQGQMVLATTYERLQPWRAGLWIFKQNGLWGVLHPDGEPVVPAQYDYIEAIEQADTVRFVQAKRYGLLDAQGREKISAQYNSLEWAHWDTQAAVLRYGFNNRFGLVDRRGREITAPLYDRIEFAQPAGNPSVFPFAQAGRWGLLSAEGKEILAAQFDGVWMRYQRKQAPESPSLFIVQQGEQTGVVNQDGRWVLPLQSGAIEETESGLIVVRHRNPQEEWIIYNQAGQRLPHPALQYLSFMKGGYIRFVEPTSRLYGLLDHQGNVVVPAEWSDVAPAELPDVFLAKKNSESFWVRPGGAVLLSGGYADIESRAGRVIAGGRMFDEQGQEIISYAKAFPRFFIPDGVDATLEPMINPCFNPDPTQTLMLPSGLQQACENPELKARLRETLIRGSSVLGGAGDILVLTQQDEQFQQQLQQCSDAICVEHVVTRRQPQLTQLEKLAEKNPPGFAAKQAVISAAVRKQLRPLLKEYDGGPLAYQSLDLNRDGQKELLVMEMTGAHNQPFWLFKQEKGQWQLLLTDFSGYLRGFETMQHQERGWPDIRVQSHASAAEHGVNIYRFQRGRYQPLIGCSQRYVDEGKPVLSCGRP